MDLARLSIDKPVVTWLIVITCLLGGIWGLMTLGRLEDPAFTIKEARIITAYPGATAEEVEEEVTERLESAIQQMGQVDTITSTSRPGVSEITVEMQSTFDGAQLPQVWDELRRRVADVQPDLPNGVRPSQVNDDFGDVYGLFYAVVAPGYSDRALDEIVEQLRRDLLTVTGVADVATAGERDFDVVVEISQDRLSRVGISLDDLIRLIQTENAVQESGSARIVDDRIEVPISSRFDSRSAVEDLLLGVPGSTDVIRLGDIATVTVEAVRSPEHLIRHNGERTITLAVAAVAGTNIVDVGQAVTDRLIEITPLLPIGVEIIAIYDQASVVEGSVNGFLISLATSVAIVIGVLCLFMGWRAGLVVGTVLLLTVLGTLLLMRLGGVELERISLGALIIAMGMLVDNAIVVAEGMMVGMQRGRASRSAASAIVQQTQIPLLGATIIGIMAFSGIGLSPDVTGEFLFSLFAVIGFSLLLSWVLAVTVTPLLGHYLLKQGSSADDGQYQGAVYGAYRRLLRVVLRFRWLTVAILVVVTATSLYAFQFVRQGFFPDSTTPLFYVDYWLPQGSDINALNEDLMEAEAFIGNLDGVTGVSTFVGSGATRFMLTYGPEPPNPAYGHMIVRVSSLETIDHATAAIREVMAPRFSDAQIFTRRLVFGPGGGADIEARFSGPDAEVLRTLAEQSENIFLREPSVIDVRTNWRQREIVMQPTLSEERMEIAGVSRSDIATALRLATDGVVAGSFRDGDDALDILVRAPASELNGLLDLQDRLIWSPARQVYIPAGQIFQSLETTSRESLVHRRDRTRTITVQGEPEQGFVATEAFARVRQDIEALPLPPGYRLEWGGEFENSSEAQAALGAQLPVGFLIMLVISILLFGKIRQPLMIWLTVPMAICGVVIGLLAAGLPFTFLALLGVLSLSGMLIKNAIVLVDEIDTQIRDGQSRDEAIIESGVSRLRPVVLAAGTTILGMTPLVLDAFFASMAVAIMGGLAFATTLTLVAVPTFYRIMFPRDTTSQQVPRSVPALGVAE